MMKMMHIALAAGGTGGHMMPAEAVGRVLLQRGCGVQFVTDERGDAYPDILQDVPRIVLTSGRKTGVGLLGKARLAVNMVVSTLKCWRQFGRQRPDVVVGFGGYPSIPAMLAARARSIPTILHEQNAVFGRSNRFLSKAARRIALSFPDTARLSPSDVGKVVQTGNPVRLSVEKISAQPYQAPSQDQAINLLIVGGSQGATILSRIVPAALALLDEAIRARLTIVHQGRAADLDAVKDIYSAAGIKAEVAAYFTDLDRRLGSCHLVIARAGASTVTEIAAAARPSILVPLPSAMDDHQTANARYLSQAGGGILMVENDFTVQNLARSFNRIFAGEISLETMSQKARSMAMIGAADKLADVIIKTVGSQS